MTTWSLRNIVLTVTINNKPALLDERTYSWHEIVFIANGYLPKPLSTVTVELDGWMKELRPDDTIDPKSGMTFSVYIKPQDPNYPWTLPNRPAYPI